MRTLLTLNLLIVALFLLPQLWFILYVWLIQGGLFFYPSSMVNLTSLHINFLLHWFTIDTNLFFLMTRHTFHAFLNAYLSKTSPLPWKERRKIGLLQFKQWYRTSLINWLFGKEIQKCKKVCIHMYISCSRIDVINPTFLVFMVEMLYKGILFKQRTNSHPAQIFFA